MKNPAKSDFLTISQVSEKYDISKSKLYKATMNREFTFYKPNGGKIFIEESEIIAWITKDVFLSRDKI